MVSLPTPITAVASLIAPAMARPNLEAPAAATPAAAAALEAALALKSKPPTETAAAPRAGTTTMILEGGSVYWDNFFQGRIPSFLSWISLGVS